MQSIQLHGIVPIIPSRHIRADFRNPSHGVHPLNNSCILNLFYLFSATDNSLLWGNQEAAVWGAGERDWSNSQTDKDSHDLIAVAEIVEESIAGTVTVTPAPRRIFPPWPCYVLEIQNLENFNLSDIGDESGKSADWNPFLTNSLRWCQLLIKSKQSNVP